MPLIYHLQQPPQVLKGETTVAGTQFYQGGLLNDQNNNQVGVFTIITDTFAQVTDLGNMDTGMLRLQVFPTARGHGHGHGGQNPNRGEQETLVLEGATQFAGTAPPLPNTPGQSTNPRPIVRAQGSVAAATPQFAMWIDHQFTLIANVLTIHD
jgi:hypothetical protein